MTDELLNPHQRSAVAVTLRRIELALRGAQAELANQDEGILFRQTGNLSPDQRLQVEDLIETALVDIAELAKQLALPVDVLDTRAALWSKLALMGVDLYDTRAAQLERYGEVAPALEDVLDPPLLRLAQTMEKLTKVLEK